MTAKPTTAKLATTPQAARLEEVERVIGWGGGYSTPEIAHQLLERKPLPGYKEEAKA